MKNHFLVMPAMPAVVRYLILQEAKKIDISYHQQALVAVKNNY